jgi:hypothetical protein
MDEIEEKKIGKWSQRLMTTLGPQSDKRRVMLYGRFGVGKTRLALQWPKPFIIDTDKGLRTARTIDIDAPYISISRAHDSTWKLLQAIFTDLREGNTPFEVQTLVIDSLTNLSECLMFDVMKTPPRVVRSKGGMLQSQDRDNSKPEWDHYDIIRSRMITLFDEAADMNLNVVATAGVTLEKDEVLGTYVGEPNVLGGFRHIAPHTFDEVYYMTWEGTGDNVKYVLYTKPFRYFPAKTKENLPAEISNPSYKKLYESK